MKTKLFSSILACILSFQMCAYAEIATFKTPNEKYEISTDFPTQPTVKKVRQGIVAYSCGQYDTSGQEKCFVILASDTISTNENRPQPKLENDADIQKIFGKKFGIRKLTHVPENIQFGYELISLRHQITSIFYITTAGDPITLNFPNSEYHTELGKKFIESFSIKLLK